MNKQLSVALVAAALVCLFIPAEGFAIHDRVYLCHVDREGNERQKYLREHAAERHLDRHDDDYLGTCDGRTNQDDDDDDNDDNDDNNNNDDDNNNNNNDNNNGSSNSQNENDRDGGSDDRAKQRYLERPSFGIDYKTWQQNHDNGVVYNGVTYPVDNEWRVYTNSNLSYVYQLELNLLTEHGLRYVIVTPNLEGEARGQTHNPEDRFSFVVRNNGDVLGITNTNATISYSENLDEKQAQLKIDGFFNTGTIKIQLIDRVGNQVAFFIHNE